LMEGIQIPGWAWRLRLNHVVPAFCAPIPIKCGYNRLP
jgi:hypothetical protein